MLNELISKFPPELQLMLASANSDMNRTKYLLQQSINWNKFLYLADYHRVYTFVYKTFSRLDKELVPKHILDALRQTCQDNTLSALRITSEMVRIRMLFEDHNIRAVVLKGVPLSWYLYGDIAFRPSGDIDMLVTPDEFEQSTAILENEGYCKFSEYDKHNLLPRQLQIYLKHHEHSSHLKYLNSEKRVLLEIHWKLSKCGNILPFPLEGNVKKIVVAGNLLPVLTDEEWLLYLVLHGAGHKWHRLNWLVDIKMFIQQKNIDWLSLDCLAKEFGVQSFLRQALILVNQVFGIVIPSGIELSHDRTAWRLAYLALRTNILDAGKQVWYSGIYSSLFNSSYDLSMNMGLKKKFNYLLKSLGPTAEDIKLVALPDRLYAVYYIIVPFTFLARRLRRIIAR
ncbi:MAG: nucleotidyltransferase family protein [Eubacteriales bacterium]|jgi:hypothetical protein